MEQKSRPETAKCDLAFVIERYFEFGGLQRDMRRFARACASSGHNVTIFTSIWDGAADDTVKVEFVDFRAWSNHRTIRNIERFVHSLRQKNEFDCITGFNRVGGLDVYFMGDPCLKARLRKGHRNWLSLLPRYRTYLQMEAAVFGPESDTDILLLSPAELANIRDIYKTDPARLHPMPPGIDRERITRNPLQDRARRDFRRDLGLTENDLMILTIGSGFRTKGIDRAIKAIGALSGRLKESCKYIVVGKGKQRTFQKIAQLAGIGSRIAFTGGRTDIGNFYYAADLLLHPARTESAGAALLEAMIAGLPVLVTENCGYAHYVAEAKAGQLCPEPFEQTQLNRILEEILTNEQDRIQYARNGRDYCETADIYSMTEKAVDVILKRARNNRCVK
jgi:UDP-glucose:(heptosyl)LPS alpha-1,3-glucosyltransferase